VINSIPRTCIAGPAPELEDVNWAFLRVSPYSQLMRTIVANIGIFFLTFFWAIPVAFISSLSNLNTLSKVKGLDFLVKVVEWNPIVRGFVQGFLPSVALLVFMALLLPVLRKVAEYQVIRLLIILKCWDRHFIGKATKADL
jgi:hypothetical protein